MSNVPYHLLLVDLLILAVMVLGIWWVLRDKKPPIYAKSDRPSVDPAPVFIRDHALLHQIIDRTKPDGPDHDDHKKLPITDSHHIITTPDQGAHYVQTDNAPHHLHGSGQDAPSDSGSNDGRGSDLDGGDGGSSSSETP